MRRRYLLAWILAATYFGVWCGFAILYQRAAINSKGHAFIFQDQLRLESQTRALHRGSGIALPEALSRRVILDASNRSLEFRPRMVSKHVDLALSDPLGRPWGAYYLALAEARGFTHFSVEVREFIEGPDRKQYPMKLVFYRHRVMNLVESNAALDFYRVWFWDAEDPLATHVYAIPKPDQLALWKRAGSMNFMSDRDPRPMIHEWTAGFPPEVQAVGIYPLPFLDNLVEMSITDPDGTVHLVRKIVEGHYHYDLEDFLYFSAVTIATVGYGDILPNSQEVRRLVMIEALLGVVLAGAFVASLFSNTGHGWSPHSRSERASPNPGHQADG